MLTITSPSVERQGTVDTILSLGAAPVPAVDFGDLGAAAGVLGTIVGAILIVGTLVAVVRANLAKAQVEALRGDRDDLMTRVQILEQNHEDEKERANRLEARVAEEVRAREVLERLVTGHDDIQNLAQQVAAHDERAVEIARAVNILNETLVSQHKDHEESANRRHDELTAAILRFRNEVARASARHLDQPTPPPRVPEDK